MSERNDRAVAWLVLVLVSATFGASAYSARSAASDAERMRFYGQATMSEEQMAHVGALVDAAEAETQLALEAFEREAAEWSCGFPGSPASAL